MDKRTIDDSAAERLMFESFILGVNTMLPGVIVSFDASTRTAEVQPAIPLKTIKPSPDGVSVLVSRLNLPVLKGVPVCLPHSRQAGLFITVPIKPGDECILVFSQRAIDNFVQFGGLQPPVGDGLETTPRHHDLTDAVCIPGIITELNLVDNWNADAIEIRNRAGTVKVSISDSKTTITGDLDVTGKVVVTGDVTAGTISLENHVHGGIETGGGLTSAPVA